MFGADRPRQGEEQGKAEIIYHHRLFIIYDFSTTEYDFSQAVHILYKGFAISGMSCSCSRKF